MWVRSAKDDSSSAAPRSVQYWSDALLIDIAPIVKGDNVRRGLPCLRVPQPRKMRRDVAEPSAAALHAQAGYDEQLLPLGIVDEHFAIGMLLVLLSVVLLPLLRAAASACRCRL